MKPASPFAHLRPTTTPEMLDRAYSVAARFWVFLWGGGLVAGADHLLSLALRYWNDSQLDPGWRVGLTLGLSLAGDFAAACALLAVFQGLMFPLRPVSPRAILRTALRKFPGYFLTHLVFVILVAFFGLMGLRAIRSGFSLAAAPQNLAAGAVLICVAVVLAVRFCLGPIACLIEDGNPLSALRRSWDLTASWPMGWRLRKDRPLARLLAVLALPAAAAGGVLVVGLAVGVVWMRMPPPGLSASPGTSMMMEVIGFVATAAAAPLLWAGLMALYIEYRMRREALDFYLRLRELSREAPGEYPL